MNTFFSTCKNNLLILITNKNKLVLFPVLHIKIDYFDFNEVYRKLINHIESVQERILEIIVKFRRNSNCQNEEDAGNPDSRLNL